MINIAIVEDNKSAAKVLQDYVELYQEKFNMPCQVQHFTDGVKFLTGYKSVFDIVFMDIEMPGIDGIKTAIKLREFDNQTVIIFVTNMSKYAVRGYEANAMDFMLKPVRYLDFETKLNKAIKIVETNSNYEIVVPRMGGFVRISSKELLYVEVTGHKLVYHTQTEKITSSGTLSKVENELLKYNFLRCNSCYLVNPKYISSVAGFEIFMQNGEILQISHPRKKQFMTELAEWMGKGNF